ARGEVDEACLIVQHLAAEFLERPIVDGDAVGRSADGAGGRDSAEGFEGISLVRPDVRRGFLFQAEDGIRDVHVTGVQTCALPISELCTRTALNQYRTRTGLPLWLL